MTSFTSRNRNQVRYSLEVVSEIGGNAISSGQNLRLWGLVLLQLLPCDRYVIITVA